MRRLIIPVGAIFIIVVGSCKKQSSEPVDVNSAIKGTWELRQTSAAMNPSITYYPAGNGNILQFDSSTCKIYTNGQPTKTTKYSIVADTTVEQSVCLIFPKDQYRNRIIFDSIYQNKFLQISGNKLSFVSGCYAYDAGHNEVYERIQ